jgi:hypothetical protein
VIELAQGSPEEPPPRLRGAFQAVVGHSPLPPKRWLELSQNFLVPGGLLFLSLSPKEPLPTAEGFSAPSPKHYTAPGGEERLLAVYQKGSAEDSR